MSILELYLLNVLFQLGGILSVAAGVFFLLLPFVLLIGLLHIDAEFYGDERKQRKATLFKFTKVMASVAVICLLTSIFIPSKEQAIWIAGGHIATNAEGIEKLPDNVVRAANAFLESVSNEESQPQMEGE